MGKGFDQYASAYHDAWFLDNRNVLYSEVNLVASTLKDAGRGCSRWAAAAAFRKILRDEYGITVTDGIGPSEGNGLHRPQTGHERHRHDGRAADFGNSDYDTLLFNGTPSYRRPQSRAQGPMRALPAGRRIILIDVPKGELLRTVVQPGQGGRDVGPPAARRVLPAEPYPIEFVDVAAWRDGRELRCSARRAFPTWPSHRR